MEKETITIYVEPLDEAGTCWIDTCFEPSTFRCVTKLSSGSGEDSDTQDCCGPHLMTNAAALVIVLGEFVTDNI